GGLLGAHLHAVGGDGGAGGQRLALALHLHQALAAGAHRIEKRVVAEPRDVHADLLGGADHQRALGHRELAAVDGEGDGGRRGRALRWSHRRAPPPAPEPPNTVASAGSNGQPPWVRCAMYSSRKYSIDEVMGLVAPSPSAQNARPRMLSDRSRSLSRSASVPCPASSRSISCTNQ